MITLTTAATESTVQGGTTVDTANAAAVSVAMTNFAVPSITISIPYGSWNSTTTTFTPSSYAQGQSLMLNLVAGTYQVGSAAPATIPGPLLTSILATVKAYRNGLESLANSAGAAPGVITAW